MILIESLMASSDLIRQHGSIFMVQMQKFNSCTICYSNKHQKFILTQLINVYPFIQLSTAQQLIIM